MSNMQVKDFTKYRVEEDGTVFGPKGKLKPFIGRGGYLKVCLSDGSRRRWVYVHRLVCECFHERIEGKEEINHIDGVKFHNASSNLEWVTRSENGLHAFENGLNFAPQGEENGKHKLTGEQVSEIRRARGVKTLKVLSKEYGISRTHLCNIQLNRYWKSEVANV